MVKADRKMAHNASSYNPNRYLLPRNHLHQQHGTTALSQTQQQQAAGYFCGNQLQTNPSHHQQQQPSQQHTSPLSRQQHQQQPPFMMGCFPQNHNGWAGIPLISNAPRRTKKNHFLGSTSIGGGNQKPRILMSNNSTEYDENAMTRLAIHAHGAPLILAGRYRNRTQKRIDTKPHQQHVGLAGNFVSSKKSVEAVNVATSATLSNDSLDLTKVSAETSTSPSDENTPNNGNNQETCLPRIIKPRKRRKKDRKPQNATVVCLPESNNIHNIHRNKIDSHDFSQLTVTQNLPMTCNPNMLQNYDSPSSAQNRIMTIEGVTTYPNDQETIDETPQKLQQESVEDESVGSCCCRICDPSCRIWAFPLRRSCSDNTAELEIQRGGKDVGVIGSNRSSSARGGSDWRNASKTDSNRSLFRNGSFSDSGDSGCDLLSGINFGDDPIFFNGSTNQISASPIGDDRNFIDFPTAETLLTESINEISKKLMETVDLRSDIFSSDSSSVFSDSVLSDDMLFNIENLARTCSNNNSNNNNLVSNNQSQVTFPSNNAVSSVLFNDVQHFQNQQHHLMNNNLNNNYLLSGINGDSNNGNTNNCKTNFVMFHEKDRENEIFNCFDMVWSRGDQHTNNHGGFSGVGGSSNSSSIFDGTRSLLPIEEQRIRLPTNG